MNTKNLQRWAVMIVILVTLSISQKASASVLLPGTINSCGEIASIGTYTLGSNISTTSAICLTVSSGGSASQTVIEGAGHTIGGRISGDATTGNPGHSFTLQNAIVTATTSANGGAGLGFSNGGNGGSIIITNSTTTNISSNGGNKGNSSSAGNGGSITITATNLNISNLTLSATGGTTGGTNGTVTFNYTTFTYTNLILSALTSIVFNGPGNSPGSMGAFVGGTLGPLPGTISNISQCANLNIPGTYTLSSDLTGDCTITGDGITLSGAGHTITGGVIGDGRIATGTYPNIIYGTSGHIFTLQNMTVTATTSAKGGNGAPGTTNHAGTITLSSSTANKISFGVGGLNPTNGALIITNSNIDLTPMNLQMNGASLTLNYTTLNYAGFVFPALSNLTLNGPGNLPGNLGAFNGGLLSILPGGTITTIDQCSNIGIAGTYTLGGNLTGDCKINTSGVTIDGGGYILTGNVNGNSPPADGFTAGYTFTLQNITVTGTVSSVGDLDGSGGNITISSSTVNTISVAGGPNGDGGSITINKPSIDLSTLSLNLAGYSTDNVPGSLTLNYSTLNYAGHVFPALSNLTLNGSGNLPGNLGAFGGGVFSTPGDTITSSTTCNFIFAGTYTLGADIAGDCHILGNSITINGGGHTIDGNIIGDGTIAGSSGHNFNLNNISVTNTVSTNAKLVGGGSGGSLTISSSVIKHISANGDTNFSGLNGNGGAIVINGSNVDLSNGTISAIGADGGSGTPGTNGTVTVNYSTLDQTNLTFSALSNLTLNGPGDLPGNLGSYVGGSGFILPGSTITDIAQCNLAFAGTYTFGSDLTGDCTVTNDGVVIEGAGYTLTGAIIANGIRPHVDGYDLTIRNLRVTGGISANGSGAGAGGSIVITATDVDLSSQTVSATAGPDAGPTKVNGTLTVNYSTLAYTDLTLSALSNVTLNGPSNLPGNLGSFVGGAVTIIPGDTITDISQCNALALGGTYTLGANITGDCTVSGNGVVLDGAGQYQLIGNINANGSNSENAGYRLTLQNITVTGTATANGNNAAGGNISIINATTSNVIVNGAGSLSNSTGGTITVTHSKTGLLQANGASTSVGFAGGTITVSNSTAGRVEANGGSGTAYFGGSGGSITITGSITDSLLSNGGNGSGVYANGGNGGTISITNSTGTASSSTISAKGGDATLCGYGGNGGHITLTNSTYTTPDTSAGVSKTATIANGGACPNNTSVSYSQGGSSSNGSVEVNNVSAPPSPLSIKTPLTTTPDVSPSAVTQFSSGGSISPVLSTTPEPAQTVTPTGKVEGATLFGSETAQKILDTTATIINSPVGKTVQATSFFTGLLASAILYVDTGFATPLLASDLLLIPLKLWGLTLVGLGIRKRARPWGTVYDSVTKQPLDPALVTARDIHGAVVAESITDLDGRYGFLLLDGTYYLTAEKTNYEFPSKKIAGQTADELYTDLYFGEAVTIRSGEVLDKNIPLDQKNFDWNEQAKKDRGLMLFHSRHEKMWVIVGDYVYAIGLIISAIATLLKPSTYNIIALIVYATVLAFMKISMQNKKKLGSIIDKVTKQPLSYAIVRVTTLDRQVTLHSGVSDAHGKYYCLVPKGTYYVSIEKKNDDGSYSPIYESPQMLNESGIINTNFAV